jgi:hypothetical protein
MVDWLRSVSLTLRGPAELQPDVTEMHQALLLQYRWVSGLVAVVVIVVPVVGVVAVVLALEGGWGWFDCPCVITLPARPPCYVPLLFFGACICVVP